MPDAEHMLLPSEIRELGMKNVQTRNVECLSESLLSCVHNLACQAVAPETDAPLLMEQGVANQTHFVMGCSRLLTPAVSLKLEIHTQIESPK